MSTLSNEFFEDTRLENKIIEILERLLGEDSYEEEPRPSKKRKRFESKDWGDTDSEGWDAMDIDEPFVRASSLLKNESNKTYY